MVPPALEREPSFWRQSMGAAVQAKLNELISVTAARNALIGIETLTLDKIEGIRSTCTAKTRGAANCAQKGLSKRTSTAVRKATS